MNLPIILIYFKGSKDFCPESKYHVISPMSKGNMIDLLTDKILFKL